MVPGTGRVRNVARLVGPWLFLGVPGRPAGGGRRPASNGVARRIVPGATCGRFLCGGHTDEVSRPLFGADDTPVDAGAQCEAAPAADRGPLGRRQRTVDWPLLSVSLWRFAETAPCISVAPRA